MGIDKLIARLAALDITMSVNGGRLELRPGSSVPAELHDVIRQYKVDLLDLLAPEMYYCNCCSRSPIANRGAEQVDGVKLFEVDGRGWYLCVECIGLQIEDVE